MRVRDFVYIYIFIVLPFTTCVTLRDDQQMLN